MVRSTNLSILSGMHFFQVIQNILTRLAALTLTDAGLRARITALQAAFQKYDTAVRRLRGSSHTAQLLALDALRDNLFRGLLGVLQYYASYSNITAKADAASLLLRYCNTYGDRVPYMAQLSETATITNIISDFAKPDAVAALAQLPMLTADWITPLKTANNQFSTLYSTRADDLHVEENGLAARFRDEAQAALDKVSQRINSLIDLNADATTPNPNFDLAATGINTEVETAKANYRSGGSAVTPPPPNA